MLEGLLEPAAAVADGGLVEGLRLLSGGLVIKVECAGAAVQIRLRGTAKFPEHGGICIEHPFGLSMPRSVRRILDLWGAAGGPAPMATGGVGGRSKRDGPAVDGSGPTQGGQEAARDRRGHPRIAQDE